MTELSGFEDNARDAILDDAEQLADDMGQAVKDRAAENFQSYASRNDYDIQHVWRDVTGPDTRRSGDTITTRIQWPALTGLFEYGVAPHTISGNPLLSFAWPSPPEGTRPQGAPAYVETQEVDWGSVTGGIDESRAIRDALAYLRTQYEP